MAFRILSEDEIQLLTDDEKAWYDGELDIYQKRALFVEQIEKQENATIEPYEAKLKPIALISPIQVRPYTKQEYRASPGKPVAKPDIQVKPVVIDRPSVVDLPTVSGPFEGSVPSVQIEKSQPQLPVLAAPVVAISGFKKPKTIRPQLPVAREAAIAVSPWKQPEKPQAILPEPMQVAGGAAVAVSAYKQPEKPQAVLPTPHQPSVLPAPDFKMDAGKKPVDLPTIVAPEVTVSVAPLEKKPISKLRKPLITVPEVKPFVGPEPAVVKFPSVAEATMRTVPASLDPFARPRLPAVKRAGVSVRPFVKPDKATPDLPAVAKPVGMTVAIQVPQIPKINCAAPAARMPAVKEIRRTKAEKANVVPPQIRSLAVKPFEKPGHEAAGLPVYSNPKIPDAWEALREFLPAAQSKGAAG